MFYGIVSEILLFSWLGNFLGLHCEVLAGLTISNYLLISSSKLLRKITWFFEDLKEYSTTV